MSEEQRKPKKKWYSLLSLMFFTILMLIVLTGVWLYTSNVGRPGPGKMPPYIAANYELTNAFYSYVSDHNGSLPILDGTYTNSNCSSCNAINISALLITNGGILLKAPDGLNLSTNGNDNCGGNKSLGCAKENHYIWVVDTYGIVYSYCTGADCETNNSGFQGVWP